MTAIDELLLAAVATTVGQTAESAGQTWTVVKVEPRGEERAWPTGAKRPTALVTLHGSKGSTLLYRVQVGAIGIDYTIPRRPEGDSRE